MNIEKVPTSSAASIPPFQSTIASAQEDARFVTVEVTEKGFELREKLSKIPSSMACCIPLKKEEAIAMIEGCKKILEVLE